MQHFVCLKQTLGTAFAWNNDCYCMRAGVGPPVLSPLICFEADCLLQQPSLIWLRDTLCCLQYSAVCACMCLPTASGCLSSSRCFGFDVASQSRHTCITANVTAWIQRASTVNKDDIYWTALVLHQHLPLCLFFLCTACSVCTTCYSGLLCALQVWLLAWLFWIRMKLFYMNAKNYVRNDEFILER